MVMVTVMVNKRDMAMGMESRKVTDMHMEMIKVMDMIMGKITITVNLIRLMAARRKYYWRPFQRTLNSIIASMFQAIISTIVITAQNCHLTLTVSTTLTEKAI